MDFDDLLSFHDPRDSPGRRRSSRVRQRGDANTDIDDDDDDTNPINVSNLDWTDSYNDIYEEEEDDVLFANCSSSHEDYDDLYLYHREETSVSSDGDDVDSNYVFIYQPNPSLHAAAAPTADNNNALLGSDDGPCTVLRRTEKTKELASFSSSSSSSASFLPKHALHTVAAATAVRDKIDENENEDENDEAISLACAPAASATPATHNTAGFAGVGIWGWVMAAALVSSFWNWLSCCHSSTPEDDLMASCATLAKGGTSSMSTQTIAIPYVSFIDVELTPNS